MWGWQRAEVKSKARASKGIYVCSTCNKMTDRVEIDHLEPCGFSKTWDEFITKLFCPPEMLRAVCPSCHKIITKEFMNGNTVNRKSKKVS
jgi:DNA-directed RNA polymerase subunit RPC12/RpoP